MWKRRDEEKEKRKRCGVRKKIKQKKIDRLKRRDEGRSEIKKN